VVQIKLFGQDRLVISGLLQDAPVRVNNQRMSAAVQAHKIAIESVILKSSSTKDLTGLRDL
jgi:hypothetical protein